MTDLTNTIPLELPRGDDLALSRGTDFFHVGEQLDEREREVLRRVREYCDTQVAPVANEYWERVRRGPAGHPGPAAGRRWLDVAREALGHAVAAYEGAVTYALRREQFGRPLARFQLVQDKLSHMLADITAMQTMCTRLSQLQAEGRVDLAHAALAKLVTASAARRVCGMARDVLGGNGILLDHHVARHHADIEAVYTYEGTDSVQSLIVGRAITGISAFV